MDKYIDWRVSITQLVIVVAAAAIGWYRLSAVESRAAAIEQHYMRADVFGETLKRLEAQNESLIRQMEALRGEFKK